MPENKSFDSDSDDNGAELHIEQPLIYPQY